MHNLVPQFILQNLAEGKLNGRFPAVTLFVDIHGFTSLTTTLMRHGKGGAEQIADVLAELFQPLVEIVYQHGGYISGFAGDSFKAIFSLENAPIPGVIYERAVSSAWKIRAHMTKHATHVTPYGSFNFNVKAAVADGDVVWGIWQALPTHKIDDTDQRNAYYFEGEAFSRCLQADSFAAAGDVLLTDEVYTAVSSRRSLKAYPIDKYWRLQTYARSESGTTIARRQQSTINNQQSTINQFFPDRLMPDVRGEFRQVITIFINLKSMPAHTDPFVARFFRLLNQYDGYLCRVGRIGDQDGGGTLLLFWGAPVSYESDVERALSFAHKLRQESPIPLRMGITADMAYAGYVGAEQRDEYTCHGSYVNLAARQMVLGEWGDILLDKNTADMAEEHFNAEEIGRLALKGFRRKRLIYRLHEEQPEIGDPFFPGTLVGREKELYALQQAIYPLTQGKFAGVITIIGEAGIGKSRLAHTFLDGLELNWTQSAISHQHSAFSAQSSATSPQSPIPNLQSPLILLCQTDDIIQQSLNPFRFMLRLLFGQRNDVDEQENKARFDARMDEFVAQTHGLPALQSELIRTRSFLGALINLYWEDSLYDQLDPKLRFDNMQGAVKTLLLSLAAHQPIVLLLEDAHWLDNDSRNFMQQLMRNIEDIPVALVITTRTPLPEGFFDDEPPIPQATITMHSLPQQEVAEFAVDVLKQPVTPNLLTELVDRTDGNPFFMDQLLLYWRENDLLRQTQQGLAVVDDADAIPSDVRTVLTARLDRLASEVKQTVQTASVLGREFEINVLSHMMHDDPSLPGKVKEAELANIWSAMTELNYLFKHALLRDAAYQMQLQSRLQALHLVAADSMVQVYAHDLTSHYFEIAYHYEYANSPRQAAIWYKLAGERAAKLYANKTADKYLEKALDLTPNHHRLTRFQILLTRERLHKLQGDRESQAMDLEALDFLAHAMESESEASKRRLAEVALRRAGYAEISAAFDEAIAYVETAVSLAKSTLDSHRLGNAYIQWAKVLWPLGRFDEANEKLTAALTLAREEELPQIEADSLRYLGVVADFQGEYEEAISYATQSSQIARELGDQMGISSNLNNLGIAKLKQGHYKEARKYLQEALTNHQEIGYRGGESWALANLGFVSALQGQYEAANDYFLQALHIFRESGDQWSQGMGTGHLGLAAANQHKYSQAKQYQAHALAIFERIGYTQGKGMALAATGSIYTHLGRYDLAKENLKASLSIYRELQVQRGLGQSLVAISLVAHLTGDQQQAEAYGDEALAIAQEIGERQIEAYALTNLGHVYEATDRLEKAAVSYQQAYQLRRDIDAEHLSFDSLAGMARVALTQGDLTAAQQHIASILDYYAANPLHGPDEPERILLTCVQVLEKAGEGGELPVIAQATQYINTVAENIEDASDKQAYLENVSATRQLLEMSGETVNKKQSTVND